MGTSPESFATGKPPVLKKFWEKEGPQNSPKREYPQNLEK